MPPKQRFSGSKGKGHARDSSSRDSSSARRLPTYPWPREENEAFTIPDANLPAQSSTQWDQKASFYYNQLLRVRIEPTRLMCSETLKELGIFDEVQQILYNAQCMSFAFEEDYLFPDITRQCLATARLTYEDPEKPSLEGATFSFFAGGKKYSIKMEDFCALYGFHHEVKELTFPKRFAQSVSFWEKIASGHYRSNSATQSRIRHPAIRVCARIFSNMLFNRDVGNKVHVDELLMLYLGCAPLLNDVEEMAVYKTNLGIRFAELICAIKDSSTGGNQPRTERIGSLLTTLFRHLRVDLTSATCVTKLEKMDTSHLISSKILRDPTTYRFINARGETKYCVLPNKMLTQLVTVEDLAFDPPEHVLTSPPAAGTPGSSSGARARQGARQQQRNEEDQPVQRLALPYHDTATQGEFDLPPISDDPSSGEYRRWMIASQRKNNSLLQRIMQTLAKGCCHRNSGPTAPQPHASSSSSDESQRLQRKKRRAAHDDPDNATSR